ncbi:unnamed protein product [Chrysoparadoxa australica]
MDWTWPFLEEERFWMSSSDDELGLGALFKSTFSLKTFEFDGEAITVQQSSQASTDHELTGEVVWPIAILLAWYIRSNSEIFRGKSVLELGAGVGVSGLMASHYASHTCLTDGNKSVVDRLDENAALNIAHGAISTYQLLWGDKESFEELIKICGNRRPQVLVAADVVCWPAFIEPFLHTVKALLQGAVLTEAALYLGYVERASKTTELFYDKAQQLGFSITEIPKSSFLPMNEEGEGMICSQRNLQVLKVVLNMDMEVAALPPCWLHMDEHVVTPC